MLCTVSTAKAQAVRMSLNDGWTLSKAGASPEDVHLPHSWNGDAYSTRNYYRGEGTYTRQLTVPDSYTGKRLFLKFDGAASKSEIFIDGRAVSGHMGAYSSHTTDITGFVTPGAVHQLEVRVDNSDPDVPPYSADFTFMGGLYRDAWLLGLPPVHFDILSGAESGIRIVPSLDDAGRGSVSVGGTAVNDSGSRATRTVVVRLIAPDGTVLSENKQKINIDAGSSVPFEIKLGAIPWPKLWSPDSPSLYRVEAALTAKDAQCDTTSDVTAFRTMAFDADGRFMLNGKPLKLRGMCRHQDMKPMGIALTDEQHRRDIRMIKDLGANFIRISHYPQDDAILEMCDRMGLIAWEEIPVIDYVPDNPRFADNCETMLREMIRRHFNHPSVACWGYMNEILLRVPTEGRDSTFKRTLDLARHLEKVVEEEDSGRMTAMAFHGSGIYHDTGLSAVTDVKGWNLYQGWYGGRLDDFGEFLSHQHAAHPDHRLIVSEYGAGSDRRLHSLSPVAFDFSIEYQQDYLEHYLPVIEDSTFIAGASHWNFIDFSSANRAESMPHINNKGLVYNDRSPKDVYYYYKAAWHDAQTDTVAHIAVRDWNDRTEIVDDGAGYVVRPIKVYTNLPEVVLQVNGRNYGPLMPSNHTAVFDVPLRPGHNMLVLLDDSGCPVDAATIGLSAIDIREGTIDPGLAELAVNVGSDCYFRSDDSGLTWLPDQEYCSGSGYGHIGGKRKMSQDEIRLTDDQPLLQNSLTELESYRFDVVPGKYEVEMLFADLSSPSALSAYLLGHNSGSGGTLPVAMDITVNGHRMESGFTPGKLSGIRTMVKRRYETAVGDDGILKIDFEPSGGGTTSLAAIKIRRL